MSAKVGTFVGAILRSIVSPIVGGACAAQAFEKCWPDEKQKNRATMVGEALKQYGYKLDDINNDEISNENMIRAKYKQLCLMHHFTRETGSMHAFQQLSINYGIVWTLLKDSEHKKDDVIKAMIDAGV